MKTVGILTTYFASNFGAMLQPFALKRVLEKKGCNVEMLRYCQPIVERFYNPEKKKQKLRAILGARRPWSLWCAIKDAYEYNTYAKHIMFEKDKVFKNYMLKHITPYVDFEEDWPKDKDYYFIGSDQLWSEKNMRGFDDVYFGKFDTKPGAKKIAYAVSAEVLDYSQKEIDYFNQMFLNFELISVREKTLAENLMRVTDRKDIEVTVDPTLLAEPSLFDEIEHVNPLPNKKFVLFYQIRPCLKFTDKIYNYARSIDADLVIFSEQPSKFFAKYEKKHLNVLYLPAAGEELFLGAMQNAVCVFTPSFHGCVFSIINHTPLFDLLLDDGRDTRGRNLLISLGLENRFLRLNDEIKDLPIEYDTVDKKLAEMREESMKFVEKALSL